MSTAEERIATAFDLVRERYGSGLSPEELEQVRTSVERLVEAADAMRSVPLSNADEPLATFVPYRAREV
ncbi:MAG: hypothetical protein IIB33_05900 [Chloroflexi bacterium]|nr:hypothetical protein [Chloroflexota bacterium]